MEKPQMKDSRTKQNTTLEVIQPTMESQLFATANNKTLILQ
jgi:hypothetical protein